MLKWGTSVEVDLAQLETWLEQMGYNVQHLWNVYQREILIAVDSPQPYEFHRDGGQGDFIGLLKWLKRNGLLPLSGKIEGSLAEVSRGVGMGEAAYTTADSMVYILGSGGAGDCIIIGAYNPTRSALFLCHAHRKTDLGQVLSLIESEVGRRSQVKVYLSSQVFSKANYRDSNLVVSVLALFEKAGMSVEATHPNTSLAINAKTGQVMPGINARLLGGAPDAGEQPQLHVVYKGGSKGSFGSKLF